MKTHILKTIEPFFTHVLTGVKTFEVRKNDRDFKVGDIVCLVREDENGIVDTTITLSRRISYILPGGNFGLNDEYCVLQLTHL